MRRRIVATFLILLVNPSFGWTLIQPDLLGWQSSTLTVYFNPTHCSVNTNTLKDVLDQAIAAWNKVPTAQLKLVRDSSDSNESVASFLAGTAKKTPLILCDDQFATNQSADPDSIPALTRLGSSNPLSYGAIVLNSEAGGLANIQSLTQQVLTLTVAHELGHVLGLGHSQKREALMYYSISGKTDIFISQDDRDGITYLYPKNELKLGAFGCASISLASHPLSTRFLGACLIFLVGTVFLYVTSRKSMHTHTDS